MVRRTTSIILSVPEQSHPGTSTGIMLLLKLSLRGGLCRHLHRTPGKTPGRCAFGAVQVSNLQLNGHTCHLPRTNGCAGCAGGASQTDFLEIASAAKPSLRNDIRYYR